MEIKNNKINNDVTKALTKICNISSQPEFLILVMAECFTGAITSALVDTKVLNTGKDGKVTIDETHSDELKERLSYILRSVNVFLSTVGGGNLIEAFSQIKDINNVKEYEQLAIFIREHAMYEVEELNNHTLENMQANKEAKKIIDEAIEEERVQNSYNKLAVEIDKLLNSLKDNKELRELLQAFEKSTQENDESEDENDITVN